MIVTDSASLPALGPGGVMVKIPAAKVRLDLVDLGHDTVVDQRLQAKDVFARHPDCAVVLDGPMYDPANHLRYGYLDAKGGIREPSKHPQDGATLIRAGGAAIISPHYFPPTYADLAIQGYPQVVKDRKVCPVINSPKWWCGGFGLFKKTSEVVFIVAFMNMRSFAQLCVDLGCDDAVFGDGGGSARVQLVDGRWWGSHENEAGGGRQVCAYLWAEKES